MASRLKNLIKRVINAVQSCVIPLCAKSATLSALYYFIFNRGFQYEQQAVLKGQLLYHQQKGILGRSSPLLRRNIHRLEKGLVMRPRKPVFALDYLAQTVDAYILALQTAEMDESEMQWAEAILKEYFSATDSNHPAIATQKKRFEQGFTVSKACLEKVPYQSEQRKAHSVKYEELLALTQSRRSTRWFEQTKVDRALVEQAMTVALQAPSACNRQPFEFYVIENESLKRKVAQLPGGTAGFADNIANLIAVVGDLSYYPLERDRHVIYIDSALASMQFMLALETLGLASCPINWPELHKQDKKVSALLGLPQHKRVVMFIAFGYAQASGMIPYSDKKSAEHVITYL